MTTPDAAAAVSLHGRTPFARGGKRACFLHPAHPDRCIKLPLPDQLPADLRRRAPWHQRLRKPVRAFDENHREWLAARWLERRGDQSVWNHVPRCHGWADTDLGRGLVVSLCRDPGGHVSPNLLDYLSTHGCTPAVHAALDRFAAFWTSHHIPAHNFMLNNLVCQTRPDGSLHIWMIDGLGCRTLIPVARWFRTAGRRDTRRRIACFHRRLERALARLNPPAPPGQPPTPPS